MASGTSARATVRPLSRLVLMWEGETVDKAGSRKAKSAGEPADQRGRYCK
jgi:hypothetical protein